MKIKSLRLHNFKRFVDEREFSFLDSQGYLNDMILVVGHNGSGKTSLLQAIVAVIAPLTRDRFDISDIGWSGFEYRFLQSGRRPLFLKAEIGFTEQELDETISFAKRLNELGDKLVIPNKKFDVSVEFDYESKKPKVAGGAKNYFQFQGYQYAKKLTAFEENKIKLFQNVGNIYWYNEQRTSYSVNDVFDNQASQINSIRTYLANAYSFHLAITQGKRKLQAGEFDFFEKLSKLYSTVFTDRRFVGSAPRFDLFEKNPVADFFLTDGNSQYELSEMSAGERAIFPILMDFARYNINNSIIIIDEIELHLHAPLQQAFVRALPLLGENNQFILTTHSDAVANMFDESENQLIRM